MPPWDIFLYLTKNLLMGATPVNTLYLSLPLPSRERTEVRGTHPRAFFTLTPTLSPQGRGRLVERVSRGSARNDKNKELFIPSITPYTDEGRHAQ